MNGEKIQLIVKIAGGAAVTTAIAFIVVKWLRKPKRIDYPRDTVILHQLPRGPYAPSISQFVVKLETYLRMTKIPYMNVHGHTPGTKGKYPWIEYNGEELADSEFIIEYLNTKLGVNLDKTFSRRDIGTARAFQKMLEENTFWAVTLDRWYYDKECRGLRLVKVSRIKIYFLQRLVKRSTYYHGIGRHSQEEVLRILDCDLRSLSDFIGTNKFLLGDEPCQADAAVFGQLSQIYWHSFGNKSYTYLKRYKNLLDYCVRMKERFWPDWDECITKGGTQIATK